MNTRAPLTTVQKMNCVLSAANINTTLNSIDELCMGAPVLFVRTFEPLFEHGIAGLNLNPSNLAAHEKNCRLVVDEVRRKVDPSRLVNATGRLLSAGDIGTIEVLTEIYYERVQYLQSRFEEYLLAPPKVIHPRHRLLKKDSSKKIIVSDTMEQDAYVQELVEKVAQLQTKLEEFEGADSKLNSSRRRKKSKDRKKKSAGNYGMDKNDDDHIPEDTAESVKDDDHIGATSSSKSVDGSKKITRRKRPSSAPARRPVRSQAEISREQEGLNSKVDLKNSLNNAKQISQKSASADERDSADNKHQNRQKRPSSANAARRESTNQPDNADIDELDPSFYTYDLNGRRVLKTELVKNAGRQQSMGIVKDMEDFGNQHNGNKSSKDANIEPTISEFPGPSTEKSVNEFLQRAKVARLGPEKPPPGALPRPRFLPPYEGMQHQDMILTIEHCTNCEYHNTTLRHDSHQYMNEADSVLRNLAQAIHEINPCIRLGVCRVPADISSKSRDSDENSRIGAFEVQIAYRDMFGELNIEMLHSKLACRRWSSKTVIQKRLASFLSKNSIVKHRNPETSDHYVIEDEIEGIPDIISCPTGLGQWYELPIASPAWCYVDRSKLQTSDTLSPSPPADLLNMRTKSGTKNPKAEQIVVPSMFIEWQFDARQAGNNPQFTKGQSILVSSLPGENLPRVGTVVNGDQRNSKLERIVDVLLSYEEKHQTVLESQCSPYTPYVACPPNEVPVELRVLLHLGVVNKLLNWRIIDHNMDKMTRSGTVNKYSLCKKSMFIQIRELCSVIVRQRRQTKNFIEVQFSGNQGVFMELQYAYGERILDWIFAGTIPTVDVDELISRVVPADAIKAANSFVEISKLKPVDQTAVTVREDSKQPIVDSKLASSKVSPRAETKPPTPKSSPRDNDTKNGKSSPKNSSRTNNVAVAVEPAKAVMDTRPKLKRGLSTAQNVIEELLDWTGSNSNTSSDRMDGLKKLFPPGGSGQNSLDVIEFSDALMKIGMNCSTEVLMSLLATFDDDGNGKLQHDELISFIKNINPDKFRIGTIWLKVRKVLTVDKNGQKIHRLGELDEKIMKSSLKDSAHNGKDGLLLSSIFTDIMHEFKIYASSDSQASSANCSLRIRKIHAHDVSSVEILGKNDLFVELSIGEYPVWKTNTLEDIGHEAVWTFNDGDESQMIVNATKAYMETASLKIKVLDHNQFLNNTVIGEASTHLGLPVAVALGGSGEAVLSFLLQNSEGKDSGIVDVTVGVVSEITPEDILTEDELDVIVKKFSLPQAIPGSPIMIDGAKFCSWLQPVNVDRTARRVAKSIDSYIARQDNKPSRSVLINTIVSKLQPLSSSNEEGGDTSQDVIDGGHFLEVLHEYSIAISRGELRAFSNFFEHNHGAILRRRECVAILSGNLLSGKVIKAPNALKTKDYEITVDMIEITGSILKSKKYNGASVFLTLSNSTVKSFPSNNRQNGTENRLLDINGNNVLVPVIVGGINPELLVDIHISDGENSTEAINDNPGVYYFNDSTHEKGTVKIKISVPVEEGNIAVEVTAHFREARSSVNTRIRKMSAADLSHLKLQPLPTDEEDD